MSTPFFKDSRERIMDGPFAGTGWLNVALTSLREITSNAVPATAADSGVLGSDTTPILNYVNGDTDSAIRLRWAASNSDKVAFQTSLPGDVDFSQPLYVKFIAAMAGATDVPTMTGEVFFGLADTKVSAASAAITGTTEAIYTITITAANLESAVAKRFMACELTLGAHTTDIANVYALWIEYSKI